jgi:hypothetical protein
MFRSSVTWFIFKLHRKEYFPFVPDTYYKCCMWYCKLFRSILTALHFRSGKVDFLLIMVAACPSNFSIPVTIQVILKVVDKYFEIIVKVPIAKECDLKKITISSS